MLKEMEGLQKAEDALTEMQEKWVSKKKKKEKPL